VGYTYTIGTGGSSVVALIHDHLLPQLIGKDPDCIEQIWRDIYFHSHATSVGAITSLALAAIDTALWDRKSIKAQLPLWKVAGGAKPEIPLYTTEGGWLHLTSEQLAEDAIEVQKQGNKALVAQRLRWVPPLWQKTFQVMHSFVQRLVCQFRWANPCMEPEDSESICNKARVILYRSMWRELVVLPLG
jgi:hypothetical protein